MMKELTFSSQAKKAIEMIENTNKNVFITGKAGTGKSTLLEYLRENSKKKMVVLAPTGVAAINVKGDTIHSFFKLKPGFELEEATETKINEKKKAPYRRLKTILIDEISMVRADLLDAIDVFLRKARDSFEPFGGVQMIFFGDMFQLPPVVTSVDRAKFFASYPSPYFFEANVCQGKNDLLSEEFKLEFVELDKIYRQTDQKFINILNAVRDNSVTYDDLEVLNERLDADFVPAKEDKFIHLMTTNADALKINSHELAKLDTGEIVFSSEKKGKVAANLCPNDKNVTVKIGAQIMFIHNDSQRRWVNGTLGRVVDVTKKYNEEVGEIEPVLIIEKNNGERVDVSYFKWEISKYVFEDGKFKREMIGSFKQIPLKLAWAITIHKSQGKTFEKVIIDLGRGSFAHGQTYVALSRCTNLAGLVLKKPLTKSSIIMDPRVKDTMLNYQT